MTKYAKIVNDGLEYAPYPLVENNKKIYTTDESIYNKFGYNMLKCDLLTVDQVQYPENYETYYELINNVIYIKKRLIEQ